MDESKEDAASSEEDEIEQLLRVNERLQEQLSATQQQLASLSVLSSSLAQQQQPGDIMVSFGEGLEKTWLNARSIRTLSLMRSHYAEPHYILMVDELQTPGYYTPQDAANVLDQAAEAINQILQPAQRGDSSDE